ncbi:MAG: UvrD-helicase domain-containing protein [Hydrogenophaga sp.]|uniref:UvrD-helicase domain-containing protein n=1 Tax=Hydrogenophaga sp. TaxID=1904254 RepID=UPI002730C4E5|nr:UvrD-helicase domain-containing protein [Hydrogenophaga sp.]MDP2405155.1 UvrD-helicase domain-containing protein [Hydrogenophaga sp.]
MTEAAYRINGSQVAREAFYALACDPARSIAVEACAGAGKTWMLVSRILRALLDGCAPQDILAITFTKKAAGEMRDRLNAELRRWSRLSDGDLAGELRARGLLDAEALRRLPEARNLHARMTALGRPVQVRTFHSWFAALLRGAPLAVLQELQLPAQYELLEDDAPAVALVWPRFYAALAASAEDKQDFLDAVAEHGRHQTLKALEKALQKRVEFALADAAGVVEASVQPFAALYPRWAGLAAPEQALLQPGARERWLAWAKLLGGESNKTPKVAASSVVGAFELADEPALMAQRLVLLRKGFFVASEDRLNTNLTKFPAAQEAEPELQDLCSARRQHAAWLHHQRLARLTRVLLTAYADLKRERGWVDMNDVEGAAQRLLGDAELSGWLQQRLDARVRHVLIDEFQDTNPLQWQALYGWLSAYAGAGSGEAPCVFLVGDPKQSIYRFRRAEPQVFKAAQAFVVQGLAGALLSCDHTRRCAQGVVQALNSAMLAAVQAGEYGSDYRAHTTESHEAGAVLALPQLPRSLRERDAAGGDEPVWRDSLTTPRVLPEDTMSALEARQAADWVVAQIEAGHLKPEQVMVLSRRRERLAWMFEALRERGIASEQPEKLDLCEAPAVQDVVALLDALVSPRHDLSLARALKSPLFGWSDDALTQLARLRLRWTQRADVSADTGAATAPLRPSWWDVLQRFAGLPPAEQGDLLQLPGQAPAPEQADLLRDTAARLALYQGWVRNLPPHDALSALYDHGDVLARFAQGVPASQRSGVLAQLRDLLAQSLAQDGGRFLTPYRLVRALKAGGIKATPVQTPGAVRLLTIHGAKGLEAHTVLMLDTDAPPSRPESMGVLVDWPGEAEAPRRFVFLASEKSPPACAVEVLQVEQQARALEELNALYVALTRAEERLVLSSFEPHQRGSNASWYQRLQPLATPIETPEPASAVAAPAAAADFTLAQLPACTSVPGSVEPGVPAVDAGKGADDEHTRIGLALHRLLQWFPTPANGFDWATTHTQAAAREFGLSPAQAAEALAMARRIVAGVAAWAWDATQLDHWGNEVELFHQGELLRLDRLVRQRGEGGSAGTWWVLDFKSHEHPERQPEYLAQMRRYQQAMALARPGEPVRLAFINPLGQLIPLSPEQLAA